MAKKWNLTLLIDYKNLLVNYIGNYIITMLY